MRNGRHPCPGLCGEPVDNRKFACPPCTRRLPADLLQAITARPSRQAFDAAIGWFQDARSGN